MLDHPDLDRVPIEIQGIAAQQILREFFRNREHGKPDRISKAGCLALYQKSIEVGAGGTFHVLWNAWREAFPLRNDKVRWLNKVDFSEVDFDAIHHDNFSMFMFGDHADFRDAKFAERSRFKQTHFGIESDFSHAVWGRHSNFDDARWGDGSTFKAAQWGADCSFEGAVWGDDVRFRGACWEKNARFIRTRFGVNSYFRGARWSRNPSFFGARFGEHADLRGTQFSYGTDFRNTSWGDGVNFQARTWDQLRQDFTTDDLWKKSKQEAEDWGSSPDAFLDIDFSGAVFEGSADFSNRHFKTKTRFVGTTFHKAPLFHGCELHQDTSFDGATFPKPTGDKDASRAYETLKLAFSKQQAVRAEQDFFRLEMDEETRREKRLKWLAFWLYNLFSDYGFSIGRPLLLLLASTFWFAWIKGDLSNPSVCWITDSNCTLLIKESLALGLSLPGLDAGSKVSYQAQSWFGFLLLHKVISLAALFLMGLALRNLFKFK